MKAVIAVRQLIERRKEGYLVFRLRPRLCILRVRPRLPAVSLPRRKKAARFRALHDGPGAFVIPNPWDVASARILAGLGFEALATSSAASASVLGRKDHGLTRDEALAHARSIIGGTDLPVSADLGNGFGDAPEIVGETFMKVRRRSDCLPSEYLS